jgi:hypothetical protein
LSNVKKPEPPVPPQPAEDATERPSKAGTELLKATDPKVKGSPKMAHQEHHHVHIYRHIRVAGIRKHRVELEDEARQHGVVAHDATPPPPPDREVAAKLVVEALDDDESRRRRQRRRKRSSEGGDPDPDEDQDDTSDEAKHEQAAQKVLATQDGSGKYFQDLPPDRMGDLTLVEPDEIKRVLGPPVRFAQHSMLLSEDRLRNGASRPDVIEFLSSLYLGLSDRTYAHKALRDFGAGSGIIDVYPLEVVKHLFENVPSFFTRLTKGPFLTSSKTGAYEGETGKPIVLTYDPKLRIRGFALADGPRPGYLFEPVDPPGTYHLIFQSPGSFKVLVSAIAKNGHVLLEELEVNVKQGDQSIEDARAVQRERAHEGESAGLDSESDAETGSKKSDLSIHFPRRV